ncbi:hypothetical protein BpHYR1_047134 [Brachionus plicatilis]|uniref:Uncharacterized protein n=1 Tax=Brachionus plicatilis TaxID=10195 RepID=A0A3M7RP70_BRAPC|nr:hypothetical protein BpHYR1_047134 [Brachionus plicatilis]
MTINVQLRPPIALAIPSSRFTSSYEHLNYGLFVFVRFSSYHLLKLAFMSTQLSQFMIKFERKKNKILENMQLAVIVGRLRAPLLGDSSLTQYLYYYYTTTNTSLVFGNASSSSALSFNWFLKMLTELNILFNFKKKFSEYFIKNRTLPYFKTTIASPNII